MKIYLDFDGTVVAHAFPEIGRCNFGSFEVIKKLQYASHEIILNTVTADIDDLPPDEALRLVNQQGYANLVDEPLSDDFN